MSSGNTELTERNTQAWSLVDQDPARARVLAEEAMAAARHAGDAIEWGRALCTIGACELAAGSHAEAKRVLDQALVHLEGEPEGKTYRAHAHLMLLRLAFFKQHIEEALEHGHAALQLARKAADLETVSTALNGLGMVYGFMGAYQRALEHHLESVRLREESGAEPLGDPLNNMGNIYLFQNEPDTALVSFQQALEVFERTGNRRGQVIALGNIGRARYELEDLDGATRAHTAAIDMAREFGIVDYVGPALAKLGVVLVAQGEIDAARDRLQEALAVTDNGSGAFRGEAIAGLVQASLAQGDHDRAVELSTGLLDDAIAANDPALMRDAHHMLYQTHEADGRWQEALEHFKRFHELSTERDRELFSTQTRALQIEHEVDRSYRERELLRKKNEELSGAYDTLQTLHGTLQKQAVELERLTYEDALTRLHNRRSLEKRLIEERSRMERYGGTFSLLVCDIDDFKETNDRFSHAIGDAVLERMGEILRSCTRNADVAARFGGEEFVVLLPMSTRSEAAQVADKIRDRIEGYPWHAVQPGLAVTVSIGVAEAQPGESFESVFAAADAQLYRAKEAGKNRVSVSEERKSA